MINYDHSNNQMTLTCDTCGEVAEFDGDFKYCISEAKAVGWWISKIDNKWHHHCSTNCHVSEVREFSIKAGNMEILKK